MTAFAPPCPSSPPPAAPPELVIEPRTGWIAIDWSEMFRYRELLYFLVWRDVKVRYKQTVLGFGWAVIQPLMNALITVLIFAGVCGFQDKLPAGVPYMLFALAGQVAWQFFQSAISIGGMSLVNQQHLLTKIYFPRLFLPTGVVGGALVDLAISLGLLAAFMVGYHFTHFHFVPPLLAPLALLLLIPLGIASLGVAYLTSALTVTFRDLRFIVPFITPLWMQASFVALPVVMVQQSHHYARWEWVLALNPMYGIVEAFRAALLGMSLNPWHLVEALAVSIGMCVFGMFYFRRTERRFADLA